MPAPRKRRRPRKPAKPNASFPLTPHNNGQWCNKIRGQVHFFGIWEDPQAALDNYLRVAADLHAGRLPQPANLHPEGPTVKEASNCYLSRQFQKVQTGDIRASSFDDCRQVAESLVRVLGGSRPLSRLTPIDLQGFRLHIAQRGLNGNSKGMGPHGQSRTITIARRVAPNPNFHLLSGRDPPNWPACPLPPREQCSGPMGCSTCRATGPARCSSSRRRTPCGRCHPSGCRCPITGQARGSNSSHRRSWPKDGCSCATSRKCWSTICAPHGARLEEIASRWRSGCPEA